MSAREHDSSIRTGGVALLAAAIGFIAVFTFLAVSFNYPDVLDAPAATALPALLAMGQRGRAVWALYGLLPLLLIPAALGARAMLRASDESGMRLAAIFAVVCGRLDDARVAPMAEYPVGTGARVCRVGNWRPDRARRRL